MALVLCGGRPPGWCAAPYRGWCAVTLEGLFAKAVTVQLSGGTLGLGAPVALDTFQIPVATHFAVGLRTGKFQLAWANGDLATLTGFNPTSCEKCEDWHDVYPPLSLEPLESIRIALDASSGGVGPETGGLAVWHNKISAYAAEVTTVSGTGSLVNLGGGCGGGGFLNPALMGSPAIGNGGFTPTLTGADPAAPLALVNSTTTLAPPAARACGRRSRSTRSSR